MRYIVAAVVVLAMTSCEGDSKPATGAPTHVDDGPPPFGAGEAKRGRAACADYKTRVCACAKALKDEELTGECESADGRIEGLELQMGALRARGDMSPTDRRVVQSAVRKTIKACIEASSALQPRCP